MAQAVPAGQKWWGGGKSPFNVEYGKLMMWYFLMSDSFTFGAFLISYGSIRFGSNGWPNPNEAFRAFPGLAGVNLPLVIEVVLADPEMPVAEVLAEAVGRAREQLVYVNGIISSLSNEGENA